ncbi:MAG: hypothetical protein NZ958_04915 [Bacteroidia bacterium]|nr:hypothetical protein [Bacteroidia bacterium]MDW8088900.1 hypothetical protein [Bacteroidia bacterium]
MLAAPSTAVREAYARELQRTWLSGKVHSTWTLAHLQEDFPCEQVVRLILFQVESRALAALHEIGYWDGQDGNLTIWMGDFLRRAREKLAIHPVRLPPLLFNAIFHTLNILLEPQRTLAQFYFSHRTALTLGEFDFYSQYVYYFDFIPAALLSYAQKNSLSVIDKALWEEKVPRILQVYEEETQERIEAYQQRFLEKITQQSWTNLQRRWKELEEEGENLIRTVVIEEKSSQELSHNLFGTTIGPTGSGEESRKARNPLLSAIDYEPRKAILEQFRSPVRRADTLRRFELEEIPIHKQFRFVQRLFEGDASAFRRLLDQLNEAPNAAEAQRILQKSKTDRSDPDIFAEFEQWVLSRFPN